jgi:hypothetical protein
MHPPSAGSRHLARALIAATFALALAPVALGQDAQDAAAASAAAAEDRPSRRERRRAAEAAAEAQNREAQTATGTPAEPTVETVEEKLVCKTIKQTGTKIGQRVCGTPEQWAARSRRTAEDAQDVIQDIRDGGAFPAPPTVPAGAGLPVP